MAQPLQNFTDKFPDLAQRMVRGNAPFRVNVREHSALIEKLSTHGKSSRRIRGRSEELHLRPDEVFPQTAKPEVEGHGPWPFVMTWSVWEQVSSGRRIARGRCNFSASAGRPATISGSLTGKGCLFQ